MFPAVCCLIGRHSPVVADTRGVVPSKSPSIQDLTTNWNHVGSILSTGRKKFLEKSHDTHLSVPCWNQTNTLKQIPLDPAHALEVLSSLA